MANLNLRDKAQQRDIDGVTYEAWPLPLGLAQTILLKFLRALGAAAEALDESSAAQFAALAKALPDADLSFIASKFGDASAYSEGSSLVPLVARTQEFHFAGRFDAYLQWLLFCAEVNFAGFFDTARRKAIADAFARIGGPTPSETTE